MGRKKNNKIGFKPKVYTVEKTPSLPVREFKKKGKVIISEKLQSQIDYLHDEISTEWSGFLLYNLREGELHDPETLIIDAHEVILMDIGSASYTEYEPDETIVEQMENIPDSLEMEMGQIHTH